MLPVQWLYCIVYFVPEDPWCGHRGSSGILMEYGCFPLVGGRLWDLGYPPPSGTCSPPDELEFWWVLWSNPTPLCKWWHWMERLKDMNEIKTGSCIPLRDPSRIRVRFCSCTAHYNMQFDKMPLSGTNNVPNSTVYQSLSLNRSLNVLVQERKLDNSNRIKIS